jgi:hypothetical protein
MATLAQVRTRVDAFLTDKWPTVVARQQNFFINRGRYWQGLLTHTIYPAHTNGADGDSIPDRLNSNPTDQFENWSAVFPEWDGVAIPCALKCDPYDGPYGKGYFVTILIRYNGVLYSRSQNVGPETRFQYGWRVENEGGPA